jgi:hypothetical protein
MAVAACFTQEWAQLWFEIMQFAYCFFLGGGYKLPFFASVISLFTCFIRFGNSQGNSERFDVLQTLSHVQRLTRRLFKYTISGADVAYHLIRRHDTIMNTEL